MEMGLRAGGGSRGLEHAGQHAGSFLILLSRRGRFKARAEQEGCCFLERSVLSPCGQPMCSVQCSLCPPITTQVTQKCTARGSQPSAWPRPRPGAAGPCLLAVNAKQQLSFKGRRRKRPSGGEVGGTAGEHFQPL